MHNYKFSLITPEHSVKNIPFLIELYDSIKKQTYDNWEWILYLNNGFNKTDLPLDILADLKVTLAGCRSRTGSLQPVCWRFAIAAVRCRRAAHPARR